MFVFADAASFLFSGMYFSNITAPVMESLTICIKKVLKRLTGGKPIKFLLITCLLGIAYAVINLIYGFHQENIKHLVVNFRLTIVKLFTEYFHCFKSNPIHEVKNNK